MKYYKKKYQFFEKNDIIKKNINKNYQIFNDY